MSSRRQNYTPPPRWLEPNPDRSPEDAAEDRGLWDSLLRVWDDVAPGEVDALLRVERSA